MKTAVDTVAKGLHSPKRLDAYLAEALAGRFSRQEIKRSLGRSAFLVNGKIARSKDRIREGDHVRGEIVGVEKFPMAGENIPLNILYEDESLFVIDKPAGLVVHPGAGNKKGTLVHALIGRQATLSSLGGLVRPGIVHRLDKETSGILLVAKNNAAHRALQDQFAMRTISKTYWALVRGRVEFEEGRVERAMARDARERKKMSVSREASALPAETRYRVLKRFRQATLLEVRLITGRTHQIRVHMKHLGHPVMGDTLYGAPVESRCARMALHAAKIEFSHPTTGKIMTFESPIPIDMKKMIEEAQQESSIEIR